MGRQLNTLEHKLNNLKIKTRLNDLLGIEYPIIQGGMAWVSTAELVAAVSNAGGLGIIGAGQMEAGMLKEQIKLTKQLTDKPFGVNVMLLNPQSQDHLEIIMKERVPVVTTGAGNPGPFIADLKERGIKVLPVCPSVALAQRLEKQGVDGIIVEGMEAGGHIGELTTMTLVPQVAAAVSIPVIAAGGIGNGWGLAAALCLGAEGVQIGTRFICASECTAHENFKNKILVAKDRDTVVTGRATGHPVRVIKNKLSREFDKFDNLGDVESMESLGVGKLRLAVVEGDTQWGSLMAGQIAGLVNEVKPAADIIYEIVSEARSQLQKMGELFS